MFPWGKEIHLSIVIDWLKASLINSVVGVSVECTAGMALGSQASLCFQTYCISLKAGF